MQVFRELTCVNKLLLSSALKDVQHPAFHQCDVLHTHTIVHTSARKTYWIHVGIFGIYFLFWALNKGLCQKYKMHETWSNNMFGAPFNIFFLNIGHYPNLLKSQNIAMINRWWQTLNTLEQLGCSEDSQQGALSDLFTIRSNLTILNCTNGKHTQYIHGNAHRQNKKCFPCMRSIKK